MKHLIILFTIVIFMMGYTLGATAAEIDFTAIDKKYEESKARIIKECSLDGEVVRKMTRQRDAGVPFRGMTEWVIRSAEKSQKEKRANPPLRTEEVLYQITIIMWVYSNKHLTPDEIYMTMNKDCTDRAMLILDYVYNTIKKMVEKNGTFVPIE